MRREEGDGVSGEGRGERREGQERGERERERDRERNLISECWPDGTSCNQELPRAHDRAL